MRMSELPPSGRLAPWVRTIRVVEYDYAAAVTTLVPEPGLTLAIRFGGSPGALVSGMRTTVRHLRTSAGGGVVVAALRELGAAQLFDVPMHELFGGTYDLADLVHRGEVSELQERIALAGSAGARAALLDVWLCGRLRARAADPLVARAVAAIHDAGGALRIAALARRLGTSQDPLEKRFRRVVGATPKQLASIVRIHRVIDGLTSGITLGELAHEAGFADQSHLVRAFRAFTGEPPGRFLRTGPRWLLRSLNRERNAGALHPAAIDRRDRVAARR